MSAENQPVTSGKAVGRTLLGVLICCAAYIYVHGQHPSVAVSKPRTVTRVVHETVTKVVQEHSGMPGWGMVVLGVVALGVLCAIFMRSA
jgi:type IV secretory pathway VirB2 component (pilin)